MEIKNSNLTSNINCKKCSKKFGYIIDTSYSTSESGFRNKAIRKNNSSKNFIKNNLKLTNNISKSNSERRVMTTLSSSDIDHIKQNILHIGYKHTKSLADIYDIITVDDLPILPLVWIKLDSSRQILLFPVIGDSDFNCSFLSRTCFLMSIIYKVYLRNFVIHC